jgi:hypothetical protein
LEAYSQALQLNPLNLIAQKNARKLSAMVESSANVATTSSATINVDLFSEEPGKSALTVLAARPETVGVTIAPADAVELQPDDSRLVAKSARGVVLGEVEAKLARRLLPLIATGNRYTSAVARVEDDDIEIIIRETYQAPENARKSSFPITRNSKTEEFRPYAKESLFLDRTDEESSELDDENEEVLEEVAVPQEQLETEPGGAAEFEEAEPLEAEDEDSVNDEDVRPEDQY